MSRFGNLELGRHSEEQSRGQEAVKDENYYLAEAATAFEEADFEKALRSYAKVLEFNPQNAAAWTGQVRALVEMGKFHEAGVWASKALENFPSEPELLAARAVALARNGDTQEAMALSDASMEQRGNSAYVWLARGDVLLARGERRADWCFDKALNAAPNNWVTAWLASRIHYYHRQFTQALRYVQRALEWNPTAPALWVAQGLCQQELGWAGQAKTSFHRALELQPGCRDAEKGLAQVSNAGLRSALNGWWTRLFQK